MSSRRRPPSSPASNPDPDPDPDSTLQTLRTFASSDLDSSIPFYNTTFSAHRISPLYIGKEELSPRRLQVLAHRLRDTLVGDVVRGVEVGMYTEGGGERLAKAGSLEAVEVRWVSLEGVLDLGGGDTEAERRRRGSRGLEEEEGWTRKSGLFIGLRYESASCTALLLPGMDDEEREKEGRTGRKPWRGKGKETATDGRHFLHMPLLLLRMPAPLKAVIADFLATQFDCRVSGLRLGTRSMVRSWEGWIRTAGLPTRGAMAKDVVITLGFYIPPAEGKKDGDEDGEEEEEVEDEQLGLKSIDVFIPAAELRRFVDAGQDSGRPKRKGGAATWEEDTAKRRKLAGRLHEEGWEWRARERDGEGEPLEEQYFMEAVGRYVEKHLGLNLFHPGVRITKIACSGFVMSEGRIKVFAPANLGEGDDGGAESGQRAAAVELLAGLVRKARGEVDR